MDLNRSVERVVEGVVGVSCEGGDRWAGWSVDELTCVEVQVAVEDHFGVRIPYIYAESAGIALDKLEAHVIREVRSALDAASVPPRPMSAMPRSTGAIYRRVQSVESRRAVVTGLGAITPVGSDVASMWTNMLAGQSGIGKLEEPWAEDLPVSVCGVVADDAAQRLSHVERRRLDRAGQLALIAAREAWQDAGLAADAEQRRDGIKSVGIDPERLAVVFSSALAGISTTLAAQDDIHSGRSHAVSPWAIPMLMPNGPAAAIGLEIGARAGVHAPYSACASSAEAVALGLRMIRSGEVDVVMVGGCEAPLNPVIVSGLVAMRAIALRPDMPERVCRPFDRSRDGLVLGEGAGALVLESAEHAAARQAHVYCEVIGSGISADDHHIVQPHPSGRGAAAALRKALADADVRPSDVDHVNAHATATISGDAAEIHALQAVLGTQSRAAISATKSMTGHLLGAAGAVESVATVLALRDHLAPPTLNLTDVDADNTLQIVRELPLALPSRRIVGVSNSFGFGGHNVVLVFRTLGADDGDLRPRERTMHPWLEGRPAS
jgi:3-oxoacyl-[acyl-carrier-protein] synthase II